MSRAKAVMQGFLLRMKYFSPRIKKVALLSELEFLTKENGDLTIVARWDKPEPGEYKKKYTREFVLGRTLMSPRPQPFKKTCDFRDDLIKEIMFQRGLR